MGIKDNLFRYWFPEVAVTSRVKCFAATSGIVLMYHEVMPDDISFPAWTVVRESDFNWQISYLRSHFDIVTMDEALKRISGQQQKSKPFALVTFDDGYRGNLDTVLPMMQSMGLPFMVYVATQAVLDGSLYWYDQIINLLCLSCDIDVHVVAKGQPGHFKMKGRSVKDACRWQEVQRLLTCLKQMTPSDRASNVRHIVSTVNGVGAALEMLNEEGLQRLSKSDCVTIGSHTHRHELLDQLDILEVKETLQTANRHIINITGRAPQHFAYPNGNYNQQVQCIVQDAGFITAVTTANGVWNKSNCLFEIPRLGIGRFDSKGLFKAKISGYL